MIWIWLDWLNHRTLMRLSAWICNKAWQQDERRSEGG